MTDSKQLKRKILYKLNRRMLPGLHLAEMSLDIGDSASESESEFAQDPGVKRQNFLQKLKSKIHMKADKIKVPAEIGFWKSRSPPASPSPQIANERPPIKPIKQSKKSIEMEKETVNPSKIILVVDGEVVPEKKTIKMTACSICSRTFALDRIQKHMNICGATASKKRPSFDGRRMRIKGTELENFKPAPQDTGKSRKKSLWNQVGDNYIY